MKLKNKIEEKIEDKLVKILTNKETPASQVWLAKALNVEVKDMRQLLSTSLSKKDIIKVGKLYTVKSANKAIQEDKQENAKRKIKADIRRVGSNNIMTGKIDAHPDGFAFFIPNSGERDFFIPRNKVNGACHGDIVQVRTARFNSKLEAHVIKVIERKFLYAVGRVEVRRRHYLVYPLHRKFTQPIFVRSGKGMPKLKHDEVVFCEIIKYATNRSDAEGKVVESLGQITDKGIENAIVLRKYELDREFPTEVTSHAIERSKLVSNKADLDKRTDFRDLFTVTIDGETARDFDDAISVEKTRTGYDLYVHIADVSHFVDKGSVLDNEAYQRGTSVYFPEFAIPMLPEILSNDVCSLQPDEDRLTVTAKISYDGSGNRKEINLYKSLIRSDARLTYAYVNELLADEVTDSPSKSSNKLDKSSSKLDKSSNKVSKSSNNMSPTKINKGSSNNNSTKTDNVSNKISAMLKKASDLTKLLKKRRAENGTIDFDLNDVEFKFDINGDIIDIVPEIRGESERIIEHFMIEANEGVAETLSAKAKSSVYRVHGEPDFTKLVAWSESATKFGIDVGRIPPKVKPKDIQSWFDSIDKSNSSELLKSLLVRSMERAKYTVDNIGHFGLASKSYTHFTSPIRRYPDLIIHRLIKEYLFNEDKGSDEEYLRNSAVHCTEKEGMATDAEREIHLYKKVAYLRKHKHKAFTGYINRVVGTGFFVYLDQLMMVGYVDVNDMPKSEYFFEPESGTITDKGSGERLTLGENIEVTWLRTDMDRLETTFAFGKKPQTGKRSRRRGSRSAGGAADNERTVSKYSRGNRDPNNKKSNKRRGNRSKKK